MINIVKQFQRTRQDGGYLGLLAIATVLLNALVVAGTPFLDTPAAIVAYVGVSSAVLLYLLYEFARRFGHPADESGSTSNPAGLTVVVQSGVAELVVAALLPMPLLGHAVGLLLVYLVAGVFAAAQLKVLAGTVIDADRTIRRMAGLSYVLDGILIVALFGTFVEMGTFTGSVVQFALVTAGALAVVGLGLGIASSNVDVLAPTG